MSLGLILNPDDVLDVVSGPVAASTNLAIGFVYEDGANGWKQVPTDNSIIAEKIYWNPIALDNTSGAKGDLNGDFYGEGTRFVGEADGAITVDQKCQSSDTASHEGKVKALVAPTSPGGTYAQAEALSLYEYEVLGVCIYKGHYLTEIGRTKISRTNAADTETNCVFELRRN